MSSVSVYMSCTPSYEPVLTRSLASWRRLAPGLQAHFEIDNFDGIDTQEGERLFKTRVWYACLLRKCEYFLKALGSIDDPSRVSVFSDADIQVMPALGSSWDGIVADMHARDLDCVFMREATGSEVNGGLLVARATGRMRAFWGAVVAAFRQDATVELGEQTLINRLLPQTDLRWDYLGSERVVWAAMLPPREEDMLQLCFHHAVCADGVQAKGRQMDKVAGRVLPVQRFAVGGLSGPGSANGTPVVEDGEVRAHIVLCRFSEDGGSLRHWLGRPGTVVYLYDRGPCPLEGVPAEVKHIRCPNVGREGYVYLDHIMRHYTNLPEVIVFSQCDVRDGGQMPLDALLRVRSFGARVYNVGQGFLLATRWCEGEGNQGLGYIQYPANSRWDAAWRDGRMHKATVSIGDFYLKHVDPCLPPITRCVTTLTGTFAAGRLSLSSRPFTYWQGLRDTLGVGLDPEVGHYVERLWAHIMLGPHAALCVRDRVIQA